MRRILGAHLPDKIPSLSFVRAQAYAPAHAKTGTGVNVSQVRLPQFLDRFQDARFVAGDHGFLFACVYIYI